MTHCNGLRILSTPGESVKRRVRLASATHQFDVPATSVGKSTWLGGDGKPVEVWYDPAVGADGEAAAKDVLARIDSLMTYLDKVFGVQGQGGNVILCKVDGGGAYHMGCDFASGGDWYEDYSTNRDMVFGLVMAEVCESYMGFQNKGWNCGGSGGEGLSRFLAEIVSGGPDGALSGFATGPSWDGVDWISKDQGTDGDYPSIGAAILYCWWMTSLGYSVAKIVQAGEPDGTLASNYAVLTGDPKVYAFKAFVDAVKAVGGPGKFKGDNPFKAPTPIYP